MASISQALGIYKPLIDEKIVTEDQLQIAFTTATNDNINVIDAIERLGFANSSVVRETIDKANNASSFDIAKIGNIEEINISHELLSKLPPEFAIKNNIIAIKETESDAIVATSNIYDISVLDQVKRYFNQKNIVPVSYSEAEITKLINKFYKSDYSIDLKSIIKELDKAQTDKIEFDNNFSSPIVRFIDALLSEAVRMKVSDIHIEPEEYFTRIRFRLDGVLFNFIAIHQKHFSAIAVRIKILSSLNIADSRNPQDGGINMVINGDRIDFRVSTLPTIYGENIVIRVLDKTQNLTTLEELGFNNYNLKLIKLALQKPEGVIIVTGPTGSGKTTTLYSILDIINSVDINIMTLEDPVEYRLKLIRQAEINHKAGFDFASGLRSILRQDPDTVFLGEIRDKETADIAIRAAITGHQVFTTLHTNSAISTVIRLIDIGIQPFMLSGSLIAVIAQRLARRLCNECKIEHTMSNEVKKIFQLSEDIDFKYWKPKGCDKCRGGYKGRIVMSEVLFVNESINLVISSNPTIKSITEVAKENGFTPIQRDGILKIVQGLSSIDEVSDVIDMTHFQEQFINLNIKL